MPNCVAIGCNNSTKKKLDGITFHKFPQNEEYKRKWIVAVKRDNWTPSKWSRLCSAHFREEDVERSSFRVYLKEHAVPKIFPAVTPPPKERLSSTKRKEDVLGSQDGQDTPRKKKLKKNLEEATKKVDYAKEQVITYKKKIKTLTQAKRRLTKKVADLEQILKVLREKHVQEESVALLNSISSTSECLMNRARLKVCNPNLKKTYDDRLKAFAITLHFLSPKAYCFVRKTFDTALPHPRTLRNWYATIKGEPGFSQEVLRALKEYSINYKHPPIASLMMDCMAIKKHLSWDGKQFYGTVNVGCALDDDSTVLASEALVFYLVFINSGWKIPVGYFFVTGISGDQQSTLAKQCISLLHDSGVVVASLTCDGTACNLSMATKLGCSLESSNLVTSFPHPITKKPIHLFLDPAHMLKLVRNTLGDYKHLTNSKGEAVEWRYIEQLHSIQKTEGLHLGNRLTNDHVNYSRQKMKVRLAAQVLSASVSESLTFLECNNVEGFDNCGPTIEFIQIFNSLFDMLNSKSMRESFDKRALHPGNIVEQQSKLKQCKEYIETLKDKFGRPILKSKRKTGFLGFLICIDSALNLYNQFVGDGSSNFPLKYLPTYKVSQDHIERLFGYIRSRSGSNNNPTCKEFMGTFKRILLHTELSESTRGNSLVLDKTVMFNITRYKSPENDINASLPNWRVIHDVEEDQQSSGTEDNDLLIPNDLSIVDNITYNIVEYISGFIVRSIFSKLNCEECLISLTEDSVKPGISLTFCKNRGGLIQPSEGVVCVCRVCEEIIRSQLGNNNAIRNNDLMNVLLSKVMKRCIGKDIFKDNDHFSKQDPDQNHFVLLIKAISKKYFTVRLHHYSKLYSEKIHKEKVRSHLTKTITFLGQ